MNKLTKGALTLLSVTGLWLVLAVLMGETYKGLLVFGLVIIGQLSMWLVLALARRQEQRPVLTPRRGILGALALLFPGVAKAIIAIAIAVGIGVGLLGLAVFAIISKVQSLKLNELKKPIILDQRVENTNGVQVVVVPYHPNSTPYPGIQLAAAAGQLAALPAQQYGISILVPAHMTLEYSTNFVSWGPIHYSGDMDELTWWDPIHPQGFFRLKADSEPVQDPTR